jgi:hypothetical protein
VAIDPIAATKLWLLIRPIRRIKAARARRKRLREIGIPEEGNMLKGYRTYLGLATAAVGFALGLLGVGEAEASTLASQIVGALDQVLTAAGIAYAAYGRSQANK